MKRHKDPVWVDGFYRKLRGLIHSKGQVARTAYREQTFDDQFFEAVIDEICESFKFDGGGHYHVTIDDEMSPTLESITLVNTPKGYRERYFETRGKESETEDKQFRDLLFLASVELEPWIYSLSQIYSDPGLRRDLKVTEKHFKESDYYRHFHNMFGFADACSYGCKNPIDGTWHFFSFFYYQFGHDLKRDDVRQVEFDSSDLRDVRQTIDQISPLSGKMRESLYSPVPTLTDDNMVNIDELHHVQNTLKTSLENLNQQVEQAESKQEVLNILEAQITRIQAKVSEFSIDLEKKWTELCPKLKQWTKDEEERRKVIDPVKSGSGRNRPPNAWEFIQRCVKEEGLKVYPKLHEIRVVNPDLAYSMSKFVARQNGKNGKPKRVMTDYLVVDDKRVNLTISRKQYLHAVKIKNAYENK